MRRLSKVLLYSDLPTAPTLKIAENRFNPIYFKERTFVAGCWCTIFDVFLFLEWWGGLSKWGPGLRLFLVRLVAVVSWCLLLLGSAEASISARGST